MNFVGIDVSGKSFLMQVNIYLIKGKDMRHVNSESLTEKVLDDA